MARGQIRDLTRARLMGAQIGASLGGVFAYCRYSLASLLAPAIILLFPPQISHLPAILTSVDVVGYHYHLATPGFRSGQRERRERE